jgi:branched-chain amino acid transport system permease protein
MPSLTEWVLFIGSGLSAGCVYAVVGLGFVLVARVTGIFNFAQGAYVMIGAVVYAGERASGMGMAPAIALALASATAAAGFQKLLMRNDPSGEGGFGTAIATLGYSIVLEGFALWIWGEYPITAPAIVKGTITIAHAPLPAEELLVVVLTIVALACVGAGLQYTTIGKAMQATAINQSAARLSGISTRRLAGFAFLVAGLLGGLLGVGTASLSTVTYSMGLTTGIVGFIAAALGEFRYPVRVVVGGLALGVVEAILSGTVSSTYSEVIVYGILIVWVAGRSLRNADLRSWLKATLRANEATPAVLAETSAWTLPAEVSSAMNGAANGATNGATNEGSTPGTWSRGTAAPVATGPAGRLRTAVTAGRVLLLTLLAVGIVLPLVDTNHIFDQTAVFALLSAVGATGLVLLMGLGGQLSLGQGMFYLLGGYCFALLVASHGWNEWIAILLAVVVSGVLGLVIGLLCLRLEGINLALVTLAADLAAITVVTNFTSLTGGSLGTSALVNARPIAPLVAFGVAIGQGKTFYYLILVLTVLVLFGARNVAKSGIGRALRAVGSDEPAAEGIGIAPIRVKLVAFVASAALAGVAGALWSYYLLAADPSQWGLTLSINLIVFIIVGGVTSVYGGLVGACVVSLASYLAVSHVAPGSPFGNAITLFISGGLLIIVLRFAPTGLIDGLRRLTDLTRSPRFLGRLPLERLRRSAELPVPAIVVGGRPSGVTATAADREPIISPGPGFAPAPGRTPTAARQHRHRDGQGQLPVVTVSDVAKAFGGVAALSGVSVQVASGEVLAVIGPNGAGKSTLINVVSGYTAADAGTVTVKGRLVHRLSPRGLCERGVVRTFQTPRTFGDMTALDAVTLAVESDRRFGVGRAVVRWPHLVRRERRAQRQAADLLVSLDVMDVHRRIESLPTGQQRLVDVARALAKRPACLMLDEPAAGLNDHETVKLGQVLSELADHGLGILLVEHDMDLVTAIADRVVVLDQGRVLTQGRPEDVMREESVLMAYLGEA